MSKVKLASGVELNGYKSGKLNQFLGTVGSSRRRMYLLPGDTVDIEISPYDLTRGLIAWRHRNGKD